MADTQDTRLVRLANDYMYYFESRKEREGSVRSQVEFYLKTNDQFKRDFARWIKQTGGD